MRTLILIIAGFAWPAAAGAATTMERCHVPGIATEVLCGEVVGLAFVLVPAHPDRRSDDAVLVLAGGPGQDARGLAGGITGVLAQTRTRRDILFVDQRGTGGSRPLRCDDPTTAADAQAWARACLAQMPPDLAEFNHANAVADSEAVRRAFGYAQWNLFGGSMGTRLAQLYMRAHPEAIRSAILDGIAPMDMVVGASMGADAQPVLDSVFARCAAQADCRDAFPDLERRFTTTMATLAAEPIEVAFAHPVTGERAVRELDRDSLALLLRALLYAGSTQRMLPRLLDRAADGDFAPLMALLETFSKSYSEMMAFGLTANILCSEDIGRAGAAAVPEAEASSFVGRAQADFWLMVCAVWPRYPVPDGFDTPLVSDIPTLLVSGEFDPVTPPKYGDALAATLTNARHLVVPGGDHTVAFRGGHCLSAILDAFIDDPDPGALDARCLERQRPGMLFSRDTGFQP